MGNAPMEDIIVEERIIESALAEIDEHGIVGFRVASVAESAGTTVSMLYRRFTDRDGLLAAALESWYHRQLAQVFEAVRGLLALDRPITVDDVVQVSLMGRMPSREPFRWRTQRVFVAAMENEVLRLAIQKALTNGYVEFTSLTESILDRMHPQEQFDPRILTELLVKRNGLIDDLLGTEAMSLEEYAAFLRKLLLDSTRP